MAALSRAPSLAPNYDLNSMFVYLAPSSNFWTLRVLVVILIVADILNAAVPSAPSLSGCRINPVELEYSLRRMSTSATCLARQHMVAATAGSLRTRQAGS